MSDFKERFNEFFDDLKGRIRNPLILSFVLVWLYFHWVFIYKMITINNALPVESRLSVFTTYISEKGGWTGMIGKPLAWSFVSLAFYYIIAIVAQAIKIYIGKRLNAYMLAKVDTGSFALKTELKEERNHLRRVRRDLDEANSSLNTIALERDELQSKLDHTEDDLVKNLNDLALIKANILNNQKFQSKFEELLMFFLVDYMNIQNVKNVRPPDYNHNYYKILNGSWLIYTNDHMAKDTGQRATVRIENDNVYDTSDKKYGDINFFKFDKAHRILQFNLHRAESDSTDKYAIIEMSPDEFLGFCNSLHCHIIRQD